MRILLLVFILSALSHVGYSQSIAWGNSPEHVLNAFKTPGFKFIEQDTNEHNQIFIMYSTQNESVIINFVFTNRKLTMIKRHYDTKLIMPSMPVGEESTIDGEAYWGNTKDSTLSARPHLF